MGQIHHQTNEHFAVIPLGKPEQIIAQRELDESGPKLWALIQDPKSLFDDLIDTVGGKKPESVKRLQETGFEDFLFKMHKKHKRVSAEESEQIFANWKKPKK